MWLQWNDWNERLFSKLVPIGLCSLEQKNTIELGHPNVTCQDSCCRLSRYLEHDLIHANIISLPCLLAFPTGLSSMLACEWVSAIVTYMHTLVGKWLLMMFFGATLVWGKHGFMTIMLLYEFCGQGFSFERGWISNFNVRPQSVHNR